MPSRGSYQITSREEGKVAQRDQSYRSCVSALLIFFFLCIIVILVCLPWKRNHTFSQENEYSETVSHHHGERTKTKSTTRPIKITEKREPLEDEHYSNNTTLEEPEIILRATISDSEVFKKSNEANDSDSTLKFERLLSTQIPVEEEVPTSSMINNESTTISEQTYEDSSTTATESVINKSSLFESPTSYRNNNTRSSTTETYSPEYIVNEIQSYITQSFDTNPNRVTEKNFSEKYETSTKSVMKRLVTEPEENVTAKIISTDHLEDDAVTDSTTLRLPQDNSTNKSVTSETFLTSELLFKEEVCTTGECKQMASKMLFFMNHTMDPCEDFYEYACGGFEANPLTTEQDFEDIAYQRIARQMQKENHDNKSFLFTKYYNSCMQYENVNLKERIRLAREVLGRVGKFYTTADWTKNHTSFTELLAKLLLHHSALLFDIAPDLDEYSPKQFTLKIGPTTYRNPFDTDKTEDPCLANQSAREQETVDLGKLYKEYKTCKNDTKRFMQSISEALTALGVFNELNNTYNISQYIQTTVINIDLEIVQKFFANYPPKNKIREAYLMKNYTYIPIKELGESCKIVNWTQLIYLLTKELVIPEVRVQVYFYDALVQGLKSLEEFRARDAMQLNNALLGLYARDLYYEFVLPKNVDPKKHCLRVAANLLIPEASSLYISSFSKDELDYMNGTIHSIFDKLKETLKLKIKETQWAAEEGRKALVEKINDLKITVPDISYFTDSSSSYKRYKADKVNLSDNYFENSMTLMRSYRTSIYAGLLTNPGHAEQIWTHYATPFQSKGLAIYGLNLIVIPFGVIDWSTKYDEAPFDYLLLATLGNVIAHQIAHHFDANGIYYWNGTRDAEYSLLNENISTNSNFEDYINCQRNILYETPMNMVLPPTGQIVSYKISQLTLNERLSETMGLRLAYDTLDRLRSHEEIHFPWLKLGFDQLFYVAYAQMHCTKSPLTSSYTSLYEDEQLPSRIRIFISASNNKLLGKAWNCPDGSQIIPSYTCSVFPYLQLNDMTEVSITRK